MDKVECSPLDRWGWECPACQGWNEEDDDPSYQESVTCEDCTMTYEPEVTG